MANDEIFDDLAKHMRRIRVLEKEVVHLSDMSNEYLIRIGKLEAWQYAADKREEEEAEGPDPTWSNDKGGVV